MIESKEKINVKICDNWKTHLQDEFNKDYFQNLIQFIRYERTNYKVFPPASQYFNAFKKCHFDNLKVVILGQDPYHDDHQAHGLCFSVQDGTRFPASLNNIFKEIQNDLGKSIPKSGNLERWATQGVLLLNATLTVRAHQAGSHQNKGWEEFTDFVIKMISEKKQNVVFLLWGAYAQKKASVIDIKKHLILKSPHPSPLSAHRGFFGNQHFSKTNQYLSSTNQQTIDW